MFSVFLKSNGNYIFKGLVSNNEKDIFIKNVLLKLGWVVQDIKAYLYNTNNIKDFVDWEEDNNISHKIVIDPITFNLQKVLVYNFKHVTKKLIEFSDTSVNLLDYYTQQEIDNYNHNISIDAQWLIDNPNPNNNSVSPDYLGVVWPNKKIIDVVSSEKYTVIDEIAGVLVDIPARILLEEAAIAAGKTKLD